MKVVLADSKYFKDSIAICSELVSEVTFKASKDGLELVAMDPANVAMVQLKILASSFVEYNVKDDGEQFSISLSSLKQILRRGKAEDVLTLETSEENQLKILLKSKTSRSFSIALLDLDERDQKVPDLQFPVKIEMPASELSGAVEDVSVVAESVTFLADANQLLVKAKGDLSQALIEIKAADDIKIAVDGEDKHKAKYSLEYLKKMISGSKLADKVSLQFNTDYPLKIQYTVLDKLSMSFILAPRVDND
ncbi:proliferating cell nuclear antigen (pcna) [archaeon]|jgi:proliferating cell nuclear antigen|nr:proliferating cell nuclear antigen (pcna) [archaeon]MBT6762767.1 proliferating cell nuclear antigen (pcna) [archaeon]